MKLILKSPCYGVEPMIFTWTQHRSNDIIETIKWVYEELPDLKSAIVHNVLQSYDPSNYQSMKNLCDRFNSVTRAFSLLEKGTSFPQKRSKIPSQALLKHILQVTYNQSVKNPIKLNQYEPFSAQVYGETSYDFIFQMVKQIKIRSDDIFIDLGSGVGQVVLQMAAATSCKLCIGIEQADIPCTYAENMARKFKILMAWYGKSCGNFKLLKGNFFDNKFKQLITNSTIIFVNNFAFGPLVDHKLKERFFKLKNGTQIISSKNFCPLNLRITERNINDIEAIMKVRKLKGDGTVSWTDSRITYYLHKITRKNLELYKNGDLVDKNGKNISPTFYNTNSDSDDNNSDTKNDNDTKELWQWNSTNTKSSETEINYEENLNRPKTRLRNICKITTNKYKLATQFKTRKPRKIIPKIPALNNLLRVYKQDMLKMLEIMKQPDFKEKLQVQIDEEKNRNDNLNQIAQQIQLDINNLQNKNLSLIKLRMSELNLSGSPNNLRPTTDHICYQNYQLRKQITKLEVEVKKLEVENKQLMLKQKTNVSNSE